MKSGTLSNVSGARMASVAHALGVTATDIVEAVVNACLTLLVTVVVIRACRWKPLGVVVATCLLVASARLQFGAGLGTSAYLAAASFGVLAMIVALRFGLLALVVSFATAFILNSSPTTLNPSDWYFPSFAADVAVLAGAAITGFRWVIGPGARPSSSA